MEIVDHNRDEEKDMGKERNCNKKFCVFHSLMIQQAVLCATRASFQASSRVVKQFSRAGRKVFPRGGYALGSYLCNKENGETLVELWGMEL